MKPHQLSRTILQIEQLEDRMMLSTVEVIAAGNTGNEAFRIRVDGVSVAPFRGIGTEFSTFTYESDEELSADQISIEFANDRWLPELGIDNNLIVDKIVIDGVEFESESPTTYSTGTWTAENSAVLPGNWESETLHSNGYFQYAPRQGGGGGSVIEVLATGSTGEEQMRVSLNGQALGLFSVLNSERSYELAADIEFDPGTDALQVEFTNDAYDPVTEKDRNLYVNKVIIDGIVYEIESPSTLSSGTWQQGIGVVPGHYETELLHTNGYFEILEKTSDLAIRAKGNIGTEQLNLYIDNVNVATFELTDSFLTYDYSHNQFVFGSQIRLEFNNDVSGAIDNEDTTVTVDWLQIDGVQTETNAYSTYSSGARVVDGLPVEGFRNGETLVENGYFQFNAIVLTPDTFDIPEDSVSVPLAVLANDLKAEGFDLKIGTFTRPQHGRLSKVGGEFFYTPDPEFVGTDSFKYNVITNNGNRTEHAVMVSVNVLESHQQPQRRVDGRVASEITPSGLVLEVEKLVKIPFGDQNRHSRMNALTTVGNRVFVTTDGAVQNEGDIFEIVTDTEGNVTVELFLDVGNTIFANTGLFVDNTDPQGGLRGLAFHPEFETNGKFYTAFMGERPPSQADRTYISDVPNSVGVDSVLAEWSVDPVTGEVDPDSYREVFRVGMPVYDHPIRGITFNKLAQPGDEDYGLLYIGHGDGSELSAVAGDGLNNDGLGKILRIDPRQSGSSSYTVPSSNPFVNDPTMIDEAFAIGFRNPSNFTFARDSQGVIHMLAAEIGRDNIEEINVVVKGGSYGWADREGPFVHDRSSTGINGNISELPSDDVLNGFVYPSAILGHDGPINTSFVGQAIAGGHVISNGSSELDGEYVFVEFSTTGRAFHVNFEDLLAQVTSLDAADPDRDDPSELTWATPSELTILFDHDNDDSTSPLIKSSLKDVLDDEPDFVSIVTAGGVRADLRLGEGPNGELYILNKRNGWVYIATNTQIPRDIQ